MFREVGQGALFGITAGACFGVYAANTGCPGGGGPYDFKLCEIISFLGCTLIGTVGGMVGGAALGSYRTLRDRMIIK